MMFVVGVSDLNLWQHIGYRRWIVWLPAAIGCWVVYFHRVGTSVVADHLVRDFAITQAADLGMLASAYFYIYAIMQIPAGILADWLGPRIVISGALVVSAVGAGLFAVADNFVTLYLGRILASLGVSVIYVNIVKLHTTWFRPSEFATMAGLVVLIGNAGALLAATPMAVVVDDFGWRAAFKLIAGFSLIVAIACWLLIRDRPTAGGCGAQYSTALETVPVDPGNWYNNLRAVVLNPYTWPPFLALVAIYGVYMTMFGIWLVPYLTQVYGLTRVAAANFLLVMAVGNMLGGPLTGFISDRLTGRRIPYIITVSCFLVAWLVLTFWPQGCPPLALLYPICFVMGVGVSGATLTVACATEVNSPKAAGIAIGVSNSGAFVGAACLQPLFGWILDQHWQGVIVAEVRVYPLIAYHQAFIVCAIVLLLGLISAWFIKETNCLNVSTQSLPLD